ncbi:MAG TPA: Wzz/FepE/Etk N-terminal domain-containing protein [Candidatus Syntrophosphaera sp.]|nr:Wzz/FepE/Etk N-terminal domain-containing protein [Candidatus Syntrophosphaera sp.]HOH48250.1 Wzz/FepE/Etk N-terminal domain-containing protein [Candidatus Syntrophosphaera sp.]HOR02892.1 Wzz/FepE/Etk N-terminal domain-containing protein [Candidatus Syntrophosphaera sp.]HOU71924.1 Wzz/FepE/Etk N-terminal domain-containing protein [Candidatus Syntrophosphaera sp.]HPK82708.1 Wzz/FepE/Etk N-terminal domain-containing protein [Candidatus Syntrophosphaera sp.]
MDKKEFDFFELLRIVIKNRRFIIIFVAVVSIGAVIYSLLTPQIWESSASFYVVGDQASALPFNIEGLSGLTSKLLGSDNAQNAINSVSAMRSRGFSEDVIRRFHLIEYYKITEKDSLKAMDLALKKLRKKTMSIDYSTDTGLVSVSAETKRKNLSRDMVDYYLQKLEIYNKEQKLTKGKMNREFLEGRVRETEAEIDSLLYAVKDFQTRHNAIDIETQTASLISSYSDVIAAKMQTDIELELARKNYAPDSPIVAELKSRSDALGRQIRDLEAGSGALKPRYLIDIDSLPNLGTQFAQLKMNLEIQLKVFEFLYPQFEAARLEELRDMPTLDILDTPREAGMRVRPKRAMLCLIAFGLALVAAVVLTLIKNVFDQNKERLQEIKKEL